jgi:NAD(P)-dependent dehydrogenase (short-subunit alcohol dehydrogenase family)
MNRLKGKSAVITGAASGIGRATAERFAREGARLVLTDVDRVALHAAAAEIRGASGDVVAVAGDVARDEDAGRMIDAAVDAFGRVDVVVANAGVFSDASALEVSVDEWDRVMAIDARGMFLTCKHAIAAMRPQRSGAIVCLSSISGVAGQARQAAYGPAKFVASGLAKHLAVEWAAEGIRVNAVAPGTIRTDGLRHVPASKQAELAAAHPLGRFGEPSEVAGAILFLASDDASFITGVVLPVDGGYLAR